MATFIEKCLTGHAQPDQIDDYVQQWHEADTPLPLHTFLGLSREQYARWIEPTDRVTEPILPDSEYICQKMTSSITRMMTNQEAKQALQDIKQRAADETKALFQQVLLQRTFPDGCRVRRIRYNEDGTVEDDITGIVVGAGAYQYDFTTNADGVVTDGYPNIHYLVRVESPDDYHSRQECLEYGLELGKAEDFWQGDERWTMID